MNLYVPRSVKRHLHRLATYHRRSISSMVTEIALSTQMPAKPAEKELA